MPKVLLVDDDEDILDLLVYNLTREGFDIRSVSNSKESILIANEFLPDLVVLDLMMPDINGIEVCRQIRKNELLKNIYIFFLTAKSDDYYKHATFNVGG
jgi:two-component system, OmpR family, alkaline phosphatase synthesis response regulator PhoP